MFRVQVGRLTKSRAESSARFFLRLGKSVVFFFVGEAAVRRLIHLASAMPGKGGCAVVRRMRIPQKLIQSCLGFKPVRRGREKLEHCLETCRAQERWVQTILPGWYLGDENFRQELWAGAHLRRGMRPETTE